MAEHSELPRVSVVMPCRNEVDHIEDCVRSIVAQEYPKERYQVIVADGMSDDGTRDVLARLSEECPVLEVVDNPGRIASTGLNQAIRAATGEVIVRMDAHAEYAPDYVAKCVEVLEETGADSVGGPWRARGHGYFGEAVALAHNRPFATGGGASHDARFEGYVDTVIFGCWKKSYLEEIGMFDEELVRNQDDELHLRITRRGGKVWQSPVIRSWYTPRSTFGSLFQQQVQYGYWKVYVIRKHRLPASFRHIVPGTFVLALAVTLLLSWSHRFLLLGFLCLAETYVVANLVASLISCWRREHWKYLPAMPLVLAAYHFGYGYGFLRAVPDMILRRKGRDRAFTRLTRGRTPTQHEDAG